ncbi:MAG: caspase family protein [Inhella sp.]
MATGFAQAEAPRVALVVGNAAYPQQGLANPRNDARAVAELLQRAGFEVDLRLDQAREPLAEALAGFGRRLRDPQIRLAVFFYAGHGLQMDNRNFLVPVDAQVRRAEDVPRQTVDASELIRYMDQARDRSLIAILDACRDDPFAGSYRPPARGLSPFDAPAGSLLAYSTAPGHVAYDGTGSNSLYTLNLVRELAVPDTTLEDAFKRVRLNVRLGSKNRQIPWESTSLEQSVILFPQKRAPLSDAELERRFEEEMGRWNEVRRSQDVERLAEFIRSYPSGHASELAQARLDRLLQIEAERLVREREQQAQQELAQAQAAQRERVAEAEREAQRLAQAREEAVRAALEGQAALEQAQRLARERADRERLAALERAQRERTAAAERQAQAEREARAAEAARLATEQAERQKVEQLRQRAEQAQSQAQPDETLPAQPGFQGQAPHRRRYRVGDVYEYRVIDRFSRREQPLTLRVTAVDEDADLVVYNDGEQRTDLMGNTLANERGSMSTARQFYPAELIVGKRWSSAFRQDRKSGWVYHFRYDLKVEARETITVPAGTFEAFRIAAQGYNVDLGASIKRTIWVVPGIAGDVAHETQVRLRNGDIEQYDRRELVRFSRAP